MTNQDFATSSMRPPPDFTFNIRAIPLLSSLSEWKGRANDVLPKWHQKMESKKYMTQPSTWKHPFKRQGAYQLPSDWTLHIPKAAWPKQHMGFYIPSHTDWIYSKIFGDMTDQQAADFRGTLKAGSRSDEPAFKAAYAFLDKYPDLEKFLSEGIECASGGKCAPTDSVPHNFTRRASDHAEDGHLWERYHVEDLVKFAFVNMSDMIGGEGDSAIAESREAARQHANTLMHGSPKGLGTQLTEEELQSLVAPTPTNNALIFERWLGGNVNQKVLTIVDPSLYTAQSRGNSVRMILDYDVTSCGFYNPREVALWKTATGVQISVDPFDLMQGEEQEKKVPTVASQQAGTRHSKKRGKRRDGTRRGAGSRRR